MQLFGKKLFTKKKVKKETHLYDFSKHGSASNYGDHITLVAEVQDIDSANANNKKIEKRKEKPTRTPKDIYKLEVLNQTDMQIKHGEDYIVTEQQKLEKKLSLVRGSDSGATGYARQELRSMIERLGNRHRLDEFKQVLEKYPHTTTQAITDVIDGHSNLRFKEASEFIPDFPDDAIAAMDEYQQMCQSLCGKDPVFYVLGDKKDFGEVTRRRDPILFAQSPFGFVWQILGAWDEEMIYLGDL